MHKCCTKPKALFIPFPSLDSALLFISKVLGNAQQEEALAVYTRGPEFGSLHPQDKLGIAVQG